jgi:ubiquinone/menaquinone biosynthesis C-methylase UbiE
VDATHIPFRDATFDAVMCCYLLELLTAENIAIALSEFRRVLKPGSIFTLVLIGQNTALFNQAYKVCGKIAPAFWGRQVDARVPQMIENSHFAIIGERTVRQGFYPSRILCARK